MRWHLLFAGWRTLYRHFCIDKASIGRDLQLVSYRKD